MKSSAFETAPGRPGERSADGALSFTVLIPARLASTRLPNKPLAEIAGVPMIVRVAQRVAQGGAGRVVVACDSPLIMQACAAHDVEAILTREDHVSGSDRLAEACDRLALPDDGIVVNVQGDEPLIDPALAHAVAKALHEQPLASMSTAAHGIDSQEDYLNPNVVKVVLDARGFAMYFSRAPIPVARDLPGQPWWTATWSTDGARPLAPLRHIGIYGYRASFLRLFPCLAPAPVERLEALEQLRAMWHGYRIVVHVSPDNPGPGVDTPQDLERVRLMFTAQTGT